MTGEITTTSVFNGAEALALLKDKHDYDLVLLDWEMPILTAPETFQQFKNLGIQIPTVMMTTKNAADVAKAA